MPSRYPQLALHFPPREQFKLDAFVAGGNAELVEQLGSLARGTGFRAVWLSGDSCTGKTHLLQGTCHAAAESGCTVAYVPGRDASDESLRGLEGYDVVALDDLERVVGRRPGEEALLALYNGLLQRGASLILASTTPAAELALVLPDLASRLRAAQCFRLRVPDDGTVHEILRRIGARRGLELPDEVLRFLLLRSRRDLGALLQTLAALDDAAMAEQRRVTVPFVKSVLGL